MCDDKNNSNDAIGTGGTGGLPPFNPRDNMKETEKLKNLVEIMIGTINEIAQKLDGLEQKFSELEEKIDKSSKETH